MMKLIILCAAILVAFVSTFAEGNEIRCFSCEDCTKQVPTIVQCSAKNGLDLNAYSYNPTYPVLTPSTPQWNANPWDPILTPPTLPPNGNQNNPWDPLLTPPPLVGGNNGDAWYPGNPILTPPPLTNGGNGNQLNPWDPQLTPPPLAGGSTAWNPGNPILTPPTTYFPWGKAKGHLQGEKRFVCATIRSKGKDHQADTTVYRRGCAEIEGYAVGVCDQGQLPVTEEGMTSCRVCGHSLCNE